MGQMAFQIISLVVSVAYQQAQARRMRREADKRKGFKINKRGEASHIPIVYGKQAVGFIEANHKVNNSYTYISAGTGGTEFLSKNNYLDQNRSAKKNQLLLINGAICQGGISEVKAIEVDESIHNKDKDHRHIFHTYTDQLGSTAPLGSSNGFGINQKFTGCAHATAAFFLNRDDYNYNGIPNCSFFVKGRKVRTVTQNGNSYSLGGYVYSNNPAYVLLDYLLGSFGRNLDDGTSTPSSINLKSFYEAGAICNSTVMSNAVTAGTVNDSNPIEAWNVFSDFPGSPSGTGVSVTSEDTNPDVIYKDESTGSYYSFTETSRDDEENTITGNYALTTLATRNIPLYECNIVLDSEASVRDNVEAILNTMPLAVLTWTSEGEYKLQLEYPSNQSALNSLAVKTFNNDNIVRDSVDLEWLAASERYNSVTVSFLNEHENFKEDSKSWPDKSSTAGQTLYNTLLNQDNNQPMSTDMRLEGVTDPYHALAHAEQIGRQSRTFHNCSFIGTKEAIGLEPGDFIKIELPLSNIDGVYRVNGIEIREDLTVKIDAYFVDINAYAWNVSDNDLPGVVSTNTPTFTPDLISNLTWSTTAQFNGVASGNLSWTASGSEALYYIVQASTDQINWTDLGTTSGTNFDVIALKQDTYYWAVKTVSAGGLISKRVSIGPYNITYTGPLTQDYIYGTTSNQDTNTQDYSDSLSVVSYPYYAVIDYPPDETPTLPIRSSSGTTLTFLPRTSEIVRQVSVYLRSSSGTPSAPSGGSYNFTNNVLTTPSGGWFASVPIGLGPIYISNATVSGFPGTTAATPSSWSTPAILGQDGADGADGTNGTNGATGGVLIIYATSSGGANKTTTYSNQEYVLYHEYVGTPPSVSSVTGTWVKFVGDDGSNGQAIWPIYATNSSGSSQSFTVGSREYVTFYESVSQPTLPVSGQTFVKYVGSDGAAGAAGANGANGSNGSAGADAPRLSTVRVYIGASSQPSAPSATITWSTLAVSSLTSGWSLTAPTIDASSTTTYYFSDISFVDATASATTTSSTGTTPTRSVNFDGIVSFTNLNTRLADANTEIDGDRITTGTIDADLVTVDNIVAGNIKPTIAGSGQSNFAGEVTSLLYPFAYHGNFSRNASFTGSSFPSTGHNSQALRAGDIFYNTNDNRTYRYNGSSWVKFSIEADSILANNIYAGTLDCSQLTVTNLDAGSISAGTISVTRLPGLSDLAYDLSAGVAHVGDSGNTTGSVTASFSSLPAGSKVVINASLGITGPGGSQDTGQGSYYATSTGNFSVSAWNLSSTNYYVSGSSNSPPKWIYHSGVATVSSTGSCSFTFTIYSTYSRRTNINTMRITALAIEA